MFSNYTQNCIQIIKDAGLKLKDGFYSDFKVSSKSKLNDLVTEYDFISEKVIISKIQELYPDHNILSEESDLTINVNNNASDFLWIIDPLDGTVNFANGLPIFSVSIALAFKDEIITGAVFNPISDELFYSEKGKGAFLNGNKIKVSDTNSIKKSFLVTGFPYNVGDNPKNCLETFTRIVQSGIPVRRLGSAALDLCYVASGRFDGFWEVALKPWDMAAGILILNESGGKVSNYNGLDIGFEEDSIVATNSMIHNELINLVLNEN